jgi:hypothetical protein
MSPLFAERPPGTVHKHFGRKVLRHFYVPFVGSTEARAGREESAMPTLPTIGARLVNPCLSGRPAGDEKSPVNSSQHSNTWGQDFSFPPGSVAAAKPQP